MIEYYIACDIHITGNSNHICLAGNHACEKVLVFTNPQLFHLSIVPGPIDLFDPFSPLCALLYILLAPSLVCCITVLEKTCAVLCGFGCNVAVSFGSKVVMLL